MNFTSFSWVTKFCSLNHFSKCENYVELTGHGKGGSRLGLACTPQLAGPGLKLWKFPLPEAGIQHRGSWLEGPPGRLFASSFSGIGDLSILCSALSRPWSLLYSFAGGERGPSRFAGIFPRAVPRCSHCLPPHSIGPKSACSKWQERQGAV